MTEPISREALITALTDVTIADCGVTLTAGRTAYVSEYLYQKSKQIPDLLTIRAIKVEWVTRHQSRRVPEMRIPTPRGNQFRPYQASNVYHPNNAPEDKPLENNSLEHPTPTALPGVHVTVTPVTALTDKIDNLEKELSELKSLIPSLQSIRELLMETGRSVAAPVTLPVAADPTEDMPMFIPSKIMEDAPTANMEMQTTESSDSVGAAAEALKSVRKGKKGS